MTRKMPTKGPKVTVREERRRLNETLARKGLGTSWRQVIDHEFRRSKNAQPKGDA